MIWITSDTQGFFPVQLQMFPAISERGQLKRTGDTLLIRFKDGTEIPQMVQEG